MNTPPVWYLTEAALPIVRRLIDRLSDGQLVDTDGEYLHPSRRVHGSDHLYADADLEALNAIRSAHGSLMEHGDIYWRRHASDNDMLMRANIISPRAVVDILSSQIDGYVPWIFHSRRGLDGSTEHFYHNADAVAALAWVHAAHSPAFLEQLLLAAEAVADAHIIERMAA
jgi:hypothetical protein